MIVTICPRSALATRRENWLFASNNETSRVAMLPPDAWPLVHGPTIVCAIRWASHGAIEYLPVSTVT